MEMKIIHSEKRLCTCCMEEHEVNTVSIKEHSTFKNVPVDYEATYLYCDAAEEFYANEVQLRENDMAMKDAYRYWEEEKFEEASYIWEYVYKKGKDQGRRAKAAANLAIYNEIEENFAQALEYIEEAMKIFVEKNYVAEAEYASSYYQDLKKRIEENNILNNMKW